MPPDPTDPTNPDAPPNPETLWFRVRLTSIDEPQLSVDLPVEVEAMPQPRDGERSKGVTLRACETAIDRARDLFPAHRFGVYALELLAAAPSAFDRGLVIVRLIPDASGPPDDEDDDGIPSPGAPSC